MSAPARRAASGQTGHVSRRVDCEAAFVNEQAVIGIAADLGALFSGPDQLDAMIEHARQKRLLLAKRIEMRRLRRRRDVAAAVKAAVDPLVTDELLELRHRGVGRFVQRACPTLALPRQQRRGVYAAGPVSTWPPFLELAPYPTTPRSTTTTDAPACPRLPRGGKPCVAAAHNCHIDAGRRRTSGFGIWSLGFEEARDGVPPVRIFLHRVLWSGTTAAATMRRLRAC